MQSFTGNQTIDLIIVLLGGQQGLSWIREMIKKWLEDRKPGNKVNISAIVQEAVKNAMPDCSGLHTGILSQVEAIRSDIAAIVSQKTELDGIKNKYNQILIQSMKFFSDKGISDFAVYKSEEFFKFVLANRETIYQSPEHFANAMSIIEALYLTVKSAGKGIASPEFIDMFYTKYHSDSTAKYISELRAIQKDKVNNKSSRFIDQSMIFLQNFLSEMVRAHSDFLKTSHDEV